jgi:Tol biopolymer transport system component
MRTDRRPLQRLVFLAATALAAGCHSDEPLGPAEPAPRTPSFAISDGVFNHGNPHFFFLPPLVANPKYSGKSDGSLQPHVLVCEWRTDVDRCGKVVAAFSANGGTGSQTVRYDPTSEQYIVNWDTKTCLTGACTLNTSLVYRIRIFVGGSQLGFADVDPTDNGKDVKNLESNDYIALVNGRTLPIKFRLEQGAVAVVAPGAAAPIGSTGGTVTVTGDAATLDIPGGALAASTNISIAPAASPPAGLISGLAPVVDLGPDGTRFATPAMLTLPYEPSKLPPGVPPSALAVYTATGTGWEIVPGSVVDEAGGTVTAPISHFSVYAIGIAPNTLTGERTPTTIDVGQSTTLTSQVYAYQIISQTYCQPIYTYYQVHTWYLGTYWERVQVGQNCYTVTTSSYYTPANLAVTWSSNPSIASVAPGPTFTDAQGRAPSPPITGVGAGSTLVTALCTGLSVSLPLTVRAVNTPQIVVLSLLGSRPEAPKFDVFLMNPDGSNMRRLAGTLDEQEEYPDLSWDAKTVVFGSTRTGSFQIFRIKADGTGLTQVTNLGFYTRAPRLSPDGQRIAFYSDAEGRYNIYTVATSSAMAGLSGVQRITDDPADEIQPDWSPDGQRIVFSSNRTGAFQLYTRDLTSGYERQLTSDPGDHVSAHWAQSGSLITYQNAGSNTIWTVNADDGQPPQQLTSGASDQAPVWSPDGSRVLFASNRAGGPYFQLHAVTLQDHAVSHFVTTADEIIPGAWRDPSMTPPTPRADRVAFVSLRETGRFGVWLVDGDGSNLRRLTDGGGGSDEGPDVSPDRRSVVFGSTRSGSFQIYSVGTDRTGLRQLTDFGFYTRSPRWSPDGRRIAFYSNRDGTLDVYVMDADGSNVQKITGGYAPDWSPDGQKLVFVREVSSGIGQLFVHDLTSGAEQQVTSDARNHQGPHWAPAGTRVTYMSENRVWVVDVESGQPPQALTDAGALDFPPAWSPDGRQMLFESSRSGGPAANLFIMGANGSGLRQFFPTYTPAEEGQPSWR